MKNKNNGMPLIIISSIIISNLLIFKTKWNTPNYIILGCALVLLALGAYAQFRARRVEK